MAVLVRGNVSVQHNSPEFAQTLNSKNAEAFLTHDLSAEHRLTNLIEMHGNQKTKQKKKSIIICIAFAF